MRVFVGYGYNARDQWIEDHVFPILQCMGFVVTDGKGLQGRPIEEGVASRIDQSDAVIGFLTIRDGQGAADFTSHTWVKDELVYASAKGKAILVIKEDGVRIPDGLLGNLQYIPLRQDDRLACVAELARALGRRNIRRIKLEAEDDELRRNLRRSWRDQGFVVRYRTRDNGVDSTYRPGRLELVNMGFYLNAADVPRDALIEIEGFLGGQQIFSSGWASADAVQVLIN